MTRKKPTLADLPAQCDPTAPCAGEVWAETQPVGREFDAPPVPADSPLHKLRGSVLRYDNATDPVWPVDPKSD